VFGEEQEEEAKKRENVCLTLKLLQPKSHSKSPSKALAKAIAKALAKP
jgi:hypothetical protein